MNKREQFSQIYQEYIDKIYRFIYVKVDSADTAEDVTSKVFMKAWEAFSDPAKGIKNPGAFLYQVARTTVIDHYRAKGRARTVSMEDASHFPDTRTNVAERAQINADIEQVKGSIQKLREDYQDVIIFHYLEDMDIKEIATLLGKPAGTVRVMLHRGLKELRDIIQES